MRRLVLIAGALVAVAHPAAAYQGMRNGAANTPGVRASTVPGVCGGTTDARASLQALLTATAGGAVIIDSGCTPLLSSPGNGGTALTLPSNTALIFEDDSSRLLLARRACTAGSYIGAGCAVDADCRSGGTCGCDVGSGSTCAFAPTGGNTYTAIGAASAAKNVTLRNPRIEVRQQDNWGRCVGTTAGTEDGLPCATNANCTGGYCGPTSGYPSGAGKINVVDFSNATRDTTENAVVSDHRVGAFTFRVGAYGRLINPDNTAYSTTNFGRCEGSANEGIGCDTDFTCGGFGGTICSQPARTVDDGAVLYGQFGRVRDGQLGGTLTGVRILQGFAKVSGVEFLRPWGAASVGIYLENSHVILTGNEVVGWYTCFAGSPWGFNVDVASSRCFSSTGPKVVVQGAGWQILGGYYAWGLSACTGGTRAGLSCGTNDTARGSGCPGASGPTYCATVVAPAIQIGPATQTYGTSVSHLEVIGARLHNDHADSGGLITIPNSAKRCTNGARQFLTCTTDDQNATTGCGTGALGTDGSACGAGHLGCCANVTVDSVVLSGVHFYGGGGNGVGVDLSALTSSATTTVASLSVLGSAFDMPSTGAVGLKFPTSTGNVAKVEVVGNSFGSFAAAGTALQNWNAAFGTRAENHPLTYVDGAEPATAYMQNATTGGTNIAANTGVVLRAGTNNLATAATTATSIFGVALEACNTASTACRVATAGPATCTAASAATFTAGDFLKPDTTTAGSFMLATTSDPTVAQATADKSSGTTSVPCIVQARGATTSGTAKAHTVISGAIGGQAGSTTRYLGAGNSTAEVDVVVPIAVAGTLSSLACHADTAPGATVTFTVRKNGADTAITCSRGTGGTDCTDTNAGHNVSVAVGDYVVIKSATGSGAGTHSYGCSVAIL